MAEIFTMLIISVVANVMVILFANGWTEKKGSSLNRTAHCNERDPPPEVALWGGGRFAYGILIMLLFIIISSL